MHLSLLMRLIYTDDLSEDGEISMQRGSSEKATTEHRRSLDNGSLLSEEGTYYNIILESLV